MSVTRYLPARRAVTKQNEGEGLGGRRIFYIVWSAKASEEALLQQIPNGQGEKISERSALLGDTLAKASSSETQTRMVVSQQPQGQRGCIGVSAEREKQRKGSVCRGPHYAGLCRPVRSPGFFWVAQVLRKPLGNSELWGDVIRFNILNPQGIWLAEGNKDPKKYTWLFPPLILHVCVGMQALLRAAVRAGVKGSPWPWPWSRLHVAPAARTFLGCCSQLRDW